MMTEDNTITEGLPEHWAQAGTNPIVEYVNPFILPDSSYVRDLDMVGSAIAQTALYISKRSGDPIDTCLAFVKEQMKPDGKFPFYDPRIEYLDSTNEGNRVLKEGTMSGYLREVHKKKYTMAATFTCYYHPDEKESFTAAYAIGEYANRKANKDKKFKYSKLNDAVMTGIYDNRQNRNKIKLNSISGAHVTTSSALYMRSTHSTLTSYCRSGTSNTNAMLERLLAGNRHLYNEAAVLNNITSVLHHAEWDLIEEAMELYQLVYPTAEDCFKLIKRSTDLYWTSKDGAAEANILGYLQDLSPLERAGYMYNTDMYSLRMLNDEFTRGIFDDLTKIPKDVKLPHAGSWIKKLSADDYGLIGINTFGFLTTLDMKQLTDPDKGIVDAHAFSLYTALKKYGKFFRAFWVTKSMPFEVASFPDSIRSVSIASDTDSAIFTNQDWVNWYYGEMNFTHQGLIMAATTTYLCSQVAQHILVQMTRNFGAADRHIREFQMKNEYLFKFFSLTTMAKHYFASMASQEGVMYTKEKWEIKGSNLKNSKAPVDLMDRSDELIKEIARKVMAGEKIEILPIMREVAEKELEIYNSVKKGSTDFFATGQAKTMDTYKQKERAPMWQNYLLWRDVFAPKYGATTPPPYMAIKVNVECDTGGKVREWLDSMEDTDLSNRFRDFMVTHKKTSMTAIWLPQEVIQSCGVPDEIMLATDVRKMIRDMLKSYYLILESLGFHITNKHRTRLLMDDLKAFEAQVTNHPSETIKQAA